MRQGGFSLNAVYANKIAAVKDPGGRQPSSLEQSRRRRVRRSSPMDSEPIVDTMETPERLRMELLSRLVGSDGWTRPALGRNHLVSAA